MLEGLTKWWNLLRARFHGVVDTWNYRTNTRTLLIAGSLIPLSIALHIVFNSAPQNFPTHELVTVESGAPLSDIAESLYDQHVVRFPLLFKIIAMVTGNSHSIYSGDYYFSKPLSMIGVLSRISTGAFGLEPVTLTIYPGETVAKMAQQCEKIFFRCTRERFSEAAQSFEGYLFPDTYTFLPNADERTIVKTLNDTFYTKIYPLQDQILKSQYSLHEIITIASILEREERTTKDRRLIAGVIENRLKKDMPLQVDATFLYLLGKGSFDLTKKDLALDNPYNTYTHKGLPPGPIGSPSLDAIEAVLNPTPSKYLYYLANASGKTFYGETYADHLRNRQQHLNK